MSPSSGTLVDVVDLALLDQAADHDALLIVDDDLGLELRSVHVGPSSAVLVADVLGFCLISSRTESLVEMCGLIVELELQLLALDVRRSSRASVGVGDEAGERRPALYGMLLPTENSAFSLSIAMMCGADRMFECRWFASAWNSTAYDGMLVPRNVCEFVERRADEAADRGRVARRERLDDRSTCSVGVCTPPSTIALPPSTGRPPCELVPMSRSLLELDLEDHRLDEDLAARHDRAARITSRTRGSRDPLDMTISEFVGLSPMTRTWPSSELPSCPRCQRAARRLRLAGVAPCAAAGPKRRR